jgi:ABC-2 type transport system ATP-binding protein
LALTITGLSKTYPNGVKALKNLSLTIGNLMFGLLGPNGAGKSSLMRTVATLQDPDSGSIDLDGLNVLTQKDEVRKILGYLPQEFGVYPKISCIDLLQHLAIMKGVVNKTERKQMVDGILNQTNLWDVRKKSLSTYSGGMKQRFGIAQALLANPKLIIVDEPTAGLDPEERVRFRNLLSELSGERIVILSTHIVSDVEAVATEIAILAHGQLLAHAAPEELLSQVAGKIWEVVVPSVELPALREKHLVSSTAHRSDGVHARVVADAAPSTAARQLEPSLEDAYLAVLATQRNSAVTAGVPA